jgi:hypothetical protein
MTPPARARHSAPSRTGQHAKADAHEVQQARADDEAHGIAVGAERLGQFGAMGMAVEDREEPTITAATQIGALTAKAIRRPRTTPDSAIPVSIAGSARPQRPARRPAP